MLDWIIGILLITSLTLNVILANKLIMQLSLKEYMETIRKEIVFQVKRFEGMIDKQETIDGEIQDLKAKQDKPVNMNGINKLYEDAQNADETQETD